MSQRGHICRPDQPKIETVGGGAPHPPVAPARLTLHPLKGEGIVLQWEGVVLPISRAYVARQLKNMEKPRTHTKILQTDSIQTLAQLQDTHDLTDFEDELEGVSKLIFAFERIHASSELGT